MTNWQNEQNHGPSSVKISLLEARKWALAELRGAGFDEEEATDNVDFLLTGALNMNYGMLRANITRQMPEWLTQKWPVMIAGLLKNQPAQYVLGKAPFYGQEFFVDERVLIPRPETELLVEWILKDLEADSRFDKPKRHQETDLMAGPSVLDVGTGSGVIILTLADQWSNLRGVGADISTDALVVANKNRQALKLGDRVALVQSDLFAAFEGQSFDVIVSNPPYIREDGQEEMDASVIAYEPDLALYAPDQGLFLYKKMVKTLVEHLNPGGRAYFEIGYDQGEALMQVFQLALPSANVTLKKDLAGLDRMIRIELTNENK